VKALFRSAVFAFLLGSAAAGRAQVEAPVPEPVVYAPAAPVGTSVDMRDGFWCQARKVVDLDGEVRSFTLIYFPKRYLTGPDTWTAGIREALVHFYGCETFPDCTPELQLVFYPRVAGMGILRSKLDDFVTVYIFTLVGSPTSHRPLGIALTN
jgi:hypothetical protein